MSKPKRSVEEKYREYVEEEDPPFYRRPLSGLLVEPEGEGILDTLRHSKFYPAKKFKQDRETYKHKKDLAAREMRAEGEERHAKEREKLMQKVFERFLGLLSK